MRTRSRLARLEREMMPTADAVAGWLALIQMVDDLMPSIDPAYVRRDAKEMLAEAKQRAATGKQAGVGFAGLLQWVREFENDEGMQPERFDEDKE